MRITEGRRLAVERALVEAGLRLFAQHGVSGTTVEQITAEAGVAKGTFYNYFATKEDVALAAFAPVLEQINRELEDSAPPGDVFAHLTRLFSRIGRFTSGNAELLWVWVVEYLRRGAHAPAVEPFTALLTDLCRQAQEAGTLRRDCLPEELREAMAGIILVTVASWYHGGEESDLLTDLERAMGLYLDGAWAPRT